MSLFRHVGQLPALRRGEDSVEVRNVSHELRTPLARLHVALEIAEESGDPDAVRKHLAGISSDVSERINWRRTIGARFMLGR